MSVCLTSTQYGDTLTSPSVLTVSINWFVSSLSSACVFLISDAC